MERVRRRIREPKGPAARARLPEGRHHDRRQPSASGDGHPARGHHLAASGRRLSDAAWTRDTVAGFPIRATSPASGRSSACNPTTDVAGRASTWCATRTTSSCWCREPGRMRKMSAWRWRGLLNEELRMELSMEKTKITDVRDGFDFLGYRMARERSRPPDGMSACSSSRRASRSFLRDGSRPGYGNTDQPHPRRSGR